MNGIRPFLSLLAVVAWVQDATAALPASQPNVLLVMTDDQGWGDVGAHGNNVIQTPTLDQLAAESVRFDRFYVSPVCAPTRASLLSGRYDVRTGVTGVTGRREIMGSDEITIAELLKGAGYRTGCFGKWHNGKQFPNDPVGQGFEQFFGFKAGHWNQYFDAELQHHGNSVQTSGYISDVITDAAIEFVEQSTSQPFFCYVPYNAPHTPWQVPDRWFDMYLGKGLSAATQSAYAMVSNLDHNIGRLLHAIDDCGQTDNTIVLFLTDNGPNGDRFNGHMKGRKGSVHEGGCRVPLFVKWPGQLIPKTVKPIAAHIDLLPTIADLCGVALRPKKPLDGVSLKPLMMESTVVSEWPDRHLKTYRRSPSGTVRGAIRSQRFRFVVERSAQLYDMKNDPSQSHNVAEQFPEQLAVFQKEWQEFVNEVGSDAGQVSPIPIQSAPDSGIDLPAVEAQLAEPVRFYNGQGWAHDWATDLTRPGHHLSWPIKVVDAGRYEVVLSYTCSSEASVCLQVDKEDRQQQTLRAASSPVTSRPERDKSKGDRWLTKFHQRSLGQLSLSSSNTSIDLALTDEIPSSLNVEGLKLIPVKSTRETSDSDSRPNMIIIYTDDQGFGDVSALNPQSRFQTPNFDRLAREGLAFTNAHSSDTVCTPSRYGLLTGRYAWRTSLKKGVMGAEGKCLIDDDTVTLPGFLKQQGYATSMVGKWHLGMTFTGKPGQRDWSQPVTNMPLDKGFDDFFGIPASLNYGVLAWFDGRFAKVPPTLFTAKKANRRHVDYRIKPPYQASDAETRAVLRKPGIEVAEDFIDNQCLTRFTDEAINWMSEHQQSNPDQPFFLYLPLTSPHYPVCPLPEFHGKGDCGGYGEFVIETDHRLGQILKFLDQNQLSDNTIVLLTSDNGPEKSWKQRVDDFQHRSNAIYRGGKRDIYEGGHRVPFLLRWPKGIHKPGRTVDRLTGQTDVLATVADCLGVSLPQNAGPDSVSFADSLSSAQNPTPRLPLINHSAQGRFAITQGRWKLVMPFQKASYELYDLQKDPSESTNVRDQHPKIVGRLTQTISSIVARGRTTSGPSVPNDTGYWNDLAWLTAAEYDKAAGQ